MKNKENHLDNLFEKAKNQTPEASFEETKGQFLSDLKAGKTSSLSQGIAKSFNFKYLIMLSIVSVAIVSTVIYFNSNAPVEKEEMVISLEKEPVIKKVEPKEIQNEVFIVESVTIEKEVIQTTTSTYNDQISDTIVVRTESIKDTNRPVYIEVTKPVVKRGLDSVYRFPKLTLEQIEQNNKQKKLMLKQVNKIDKKKYAYIPSGTFSDQGESISVQAFYMGTTEVTVLEYRTFVFDLLIHNRKNDFLIAKPDQDQWNHINGYTQTFNQPMVDHYFSHPAYDEYPINNISRAGAELYCKWLTLEASKVRKGKKQQLNDFRIPSDYEWMLAAYGGAENDKKVSFPWGTNSVKNDKNCYLANYKPRVDSLWNKESGKYETYDSKSVFLDDGAFHTAKVDSYLPNSFGLYCMSGNVAEMVIKWKDKSPGTKGGSWISELEELQINGVDKYSGVTKGEANIGFRVVMSLVNE